MRPSVRLLVDAPLTGAATVANKVPLKRRRPQLTTFKKRQEVIEVPASREVLDATPQVNDLRREPIGVYLFDHKSEQSLLGISE